MAAESNQASEPNDRGGSDQHPGGASRESKLDCPLCGKRPKSERKNDDGWMEEGRIVCCGLHSEWCVGSWGYAWKTWDDLVRRILSLRFTGADVRDGQIASDKQEDMATCYRICRELQGHDSKAVWQKLREEFSDRSDNEIAVLVIELEKIVSQSSKPVGC